MYRSIKETHPDVFVLQDCAHSYFCEDKNGAIEAVSGDGALFGMNISKLVNSVKGGMLTLRSGSLASEIRKLQKQEGGDQRGFWGALKTRLYALASGLAFTPWGYNLVEWMKKNTAVLDSEVYYYDAEEIDFPKDYFMPMLPIQAEVGLRSMDKLQLRVKVRREIAHHYFELLSQLGGKGLVLPPVQSGNTWSHFPILVPVEKRDKIRVALEKKARVEVGVLVDYSIPELPAYSEQFNSSCGHASKVVLRVLNLPLTLSEGLFSARNWKNKATEICDVIEQEIGE